MFRVNKPSIKYTKTMYCRKTLLKYLKCHPKAYSAADHLQPHQYNHNRPKKKDHLNRQKKNSKKKKKKKERRSIFQKEQFSSLSFSEPPLPPAPPLNTPDLTDYTNPLFPNKSCLQWISTPTSQRF